MRGTISALLLVAAAGCATSYAISDRHAVMIARQVCESKEDWAETATYNARRDGRMWSVLVHRVTGEDEHGNPEFDLEETRTVLIDIAGKVIEYHTPPVVTSPADTDMVGFFEDAGAAESAADAEGTKDDEGAEDGEETEQVEAEE